MLIIRIIPWGLDIHDGRAIGWRWVLHLGPWLIYVLRCEPEDAA